MSSRDRTRSQDARRSGGSVMSQSAQVRPGRSCWSNDGATWSSGRLADPCDGEVPRLPIYEGDQLVIKTPISHLSVNSTGEVGRTDDYLTGMRVVPVRQEGNVIFGRSLRRGEQDTGAR